jgi:hypothetical protein
MKTNALMDRMMEEEWKRECEEEVLERKVRDAKRRRGEDVNDGGDADEFTRDREATLALTPLRDRKWSVNDAILLHGTLEEVSLHIPREEGWTITTFEKERKLLFQSLDAACRSTLSKLHTAFRLLHQSVTILELERIMNEMTLWLVEYAKKRELKVKGISREGYGEGFTLSLWHYEETKKTCDLHRIRQYASLGSAIIYLSAKRHGKGRTLAEICGAFGAVRFNGGREEPLVRPKFCSKAMQELRTVMPGVVVAPPASALEGVAASAAVLDSSISTQKPAADATVFTPVKTESKPLLHEGSTSVVSLSSTSSSGTALDTSSHNIIINDDSSVNTNLPQSGNEALADLTSRLATSLDLPPGAIAAAVAIAVQCSNDVISTPIAKGRQIRPPIRRGNKSNSSLFIKSRGVKRTCGLGAVLKKEGSADSIAVASILLVCMAGQKMQILAQQALNNHQEQPTKKTTEEEKDQLADPIACLSNPLDDLAEEIASNDQSPVETTSINTHKSAPATTITSQVKPSPIESWTAWNHQPPWHRGVSQMEQCSGVSSKTIISYYSNVLHPRRSYFLDVARKRLSELEGSHLTKRIKTEHDNTKSRANDSSLLQNITAAAPLISIRGL